MSNNKNNDMIAVPAGWVSRNETDELQAAQNKFNPSSPEYSVPSMTPRIAEKLGQKVVGGAISSVMDAEPSASVASESVVEAAAPANIKTTPGTFEFEQEQNRLAGIAYAELALMNSNAHSKKN